MGPRTRQGSQLWLAPPLLANFLPAQPLAAWGGGSGGGVLIWLPSG